MPKKYENKSNHNQDFLESIHNDYPNTFFDWKVTVQFYTALHKAYCVIIFNGHEVTTSHNHNITTLGTVNPELGKALFLVYKNSRQSRYEGFMTDEAMERINKINFEKGLTTLKRFKELSETLYSLAV